MIYESVDSGQAIRQGDIFRNIPRLEISLSEIPIIDKEGTRITSWKDLVDDVEEEEDVTAVVTLRPVSGVVITQDCDAARGKDLCLALIDDFVEVSGQNPQNPKNWAKLITKNAKANLRYFYLPAAEPFGLPKPSAADFRTILRVPLEDIIENGAVRLGRLNNVAYEHLRETLAQFYRRYPYNEWYPLDKEQAAAYAKDCPEPVELYDWQK